MRRHFVLVDARSKSFLRSPLADNLEGMPKRLVLMILAVLVTLSRIQASQLQPLEILLTNDDGVRAPGIDILAGALRGVGTVTVIAPSENQSASGHSLSTTAPIYLDNVTLPNGLTAIGLHATPATSVRQRARRQVSLGRVSRLGPHRGLRTPFRRVREVGERRTGATHVFSPRQAADALGWRASNAVICIQAGAF
jgi:hypothetical protein